VSKCQTCKGATWVKWMVGEGRPALPANLQADSDGVRWLGGSGEGYNLVRCPVCNSATGPTVAERRKAQGVAA
jgi:hypothetical protein